MNTPEENARIMDARIDAICVNLDTSTREKAIAAYMAGYDDATEYALKLMDPEHVTKSVAEKMARCA